MSLILRRTMVLAAAGAVLALGACNSKGGGSANADPHSMGPANAKVTVLEYASPTCPHCGAWEREVWPAFKAKYIDTGKVHYVLRETPIHEAIDYASFLLANCAPKDKYFDVIQAIMRGQETFLEPLGRGDTAPFRDTLMNIGQSMGMSKDKTAACISDTKAAEALIARSRKEAEEYQVGSTPTFVVNGKKMNDDHPPSLAELDAAIGPQLAK